MALATAPERVRAPAAPPVVADKTPSRGAVQSPGRGDPRWTLGRTAVLCGVIVLVSLMLVVAASAYLTQGEVRLTRMQQELTSELGQHRNLLARAARLYDPSSVVSQAERDGLDAPSKVTDLPQVDVTTPSTPASSASTPSTTASTAPVAGHPPVATTGGR